MGRHLNGRIARWLEPLSFASRRGALGMAVGVAVLCGVASLWLCGVDGWDQRNYHLYNGWAVWNGRLALDLAPAQMQSYFVPWMDAAYWALMQVSPGATGFVLGAWHGTCFALVAAIAWVVLEADARRAWLAPLLGLSGMLSGVFLYELGGTHGDNATAPFVLAAFWCALAADRSGARRWILLSGTLLALALALKMSNSIYAVGLGASVLCGQGTPARRMRHALLLAATTLLVFAVVAGPWFWMVWQQFGNPIFPKFNTFFHAALAGEVPVVTANKLPKSWHEALLFPLWMSVDPKRVNGVQQLTWALAWVSCVAGLVVLALHRVAAKPRAPASEVRPAVRMLWAFIAVTFVVWMARFSVHRYLVAAELLAPLALWLLVVRLAPARIAWQSAAAVVAGCVLGALFGWQAPEAGGWLRAEVVVDAPRIAAPEAATVLLVGRGPQAWRVPFLPEQAVYAGLEGNFTASAAYSQRVHAIASARGGDVYAMFPAAVSKHAARAGALNRRAAGLGAAGCLQLQEHARGSKKRLVYVAATEDSPCSLRVARGEQKRMLEFNRTRQEATDAVLHAHGWRLLPETCEVHGSRIGDGEYPYQWCLLREDS